MADSSLVDALNDNKLECADLLLQHGADPNKVLPEQSVSPMHLAAGLGMKHVCLLLQHGGDPNLRLSDGTTPLHVSAMWGDSDCVQILLSNGGDPFTRDQEGFSAMDFARKYKQWEVVEVIKKYIFLLTTAEEVTLTPKYTYTRRSVERNLSSNSTFVESDNGETHDPIRLDLKEFTQRRRSSVYLHSVQRQIDKCFREGQKTHVVDVTSPDHPFIEPKYDEISPEELILTATSPEESLHLHLSMSDNEDATCTSSASFVTCDGDDLDTCIKLSSLLVPLGNDTDASKTSCPATVKQQSPKDPTYKTKSERKKKYCRRDPVLPLSPQVLFCGDEANEKCAYCDCVVRHFTSNKENLCSSCERLGLELEELTLKASTPNCHVESKKHPQNDQGLNRRDHQGNKTLGNFRLSKMDTTSNRFYHNNHIQSEVRNGFIQSVNTTQSQSKDYIIEKDKDTDRDLDQCFIQSMISDDSLVSLDQGYEERKIEKSEFHPSDISTITVSDHSQDNAFLQTGSNNGDINGTTILKCKDTNCRRSFKGSGKQNGKEKDNLNQDAKGLKDLNTDSYVIKRQNSWSPQLDDLWTEVRASAMKAKKIRERKILDTAFIGRESMTSGVSDASTIDYVYTDRENGIILLERHLPSQCSSRGSRRSLESLFSLEISPKGGNSSHNSSLSSSQDTVNYDWKEHAMIGVSDDSGNGEPCPNADPLSQDLLKLGNEEIRTKLRNYWDDPGPVTDTTRQTYLRRLSQLQNDPSAKWLSKKGPEYPPELIQALNGKLDLTDCNEVEAKMVEAFQNPNRLRRWREGTLKSSFNYVLLDPRITDNLPNRALNMNDLDVFKTFISAIFYVGKGKRARPYCHLYEAIKHMKKANGKASTKVQQIIDIWSNDMGVVSLHCFQSVIPVEAYTREACMVDAIGLKNLTNMKRGDYYGVSTTFPMKQRRRVGVYLLTKALQIFLAEGERQISPLDIKNDP